MTATKNRSYLDDHGYELCAYGLTRNAYKMTDGTRIEKYFRVSGRTEDMGYTNSVSYLFLNTATGTVLNGTPSTEVVKKVWQPEVTINGRVLEGRWNITRTWKNAVKYTKVLCDEEIGCGCGQAIDNCDEAWGRNEG